MLPTLPNLVVIGAQKGGSTFLLNCLGEHPNVYMYPQEDAYFQNPDYDQTSQADFARRYEPGRGKRIIGLKRPNYLASPECAPRIANDLPEARLIAILRNPVDRAISAYFHLMRSNYIPFLPLDEGLTAILDGRTQKTHPAARFIIEYSLYAKHINHYLNYIARKRLLLLLYDDLKPDPMPLLRRTFRFLDIDETFVPGPSLSSRPMASIRSIPRLAIHRVIRPMYAARFAAGTRHRLRRGQIAPMFRLAFNAFDRHVMTRIFKNPKPILSSEVRQKMIDRFRPDMLDLQTLLDRNLEHWIDAHETD